MLDKFKATWVSHSSIGDFLECPRLYYLRNVYKDPKTGRKVNIVNPYMSLGIAVHNVLEGLVEYPADERMERSLIDLFKEEWKKVSGKIGGFQDQETEDLFYERGVQMIKRAEENPEIFKDKTIRIKEDLPWFWLSEEEEIILCGKIDWIRYVEKYDSVEIIDFKTGKNKESDDSFQLPIYMLLMKNCQDRKTTGAYYWYLDSDDSLTPEELPNIEKAEKDILEVARKIKEARSKKEFICPHGGCKGCQPFEQILKGEAEFVGVGPYRQDLYILPKHDKLL